MCSMAAARSIALTMSYTVSAATVAAVKASISTPVCALVRVVATIRSDDENVLRDLRRQVERQLQVGFERLQVAVVDADHVCTKRQRSIQLSLIVYLHQDIHPVIVAGEREHGTCGLVVDHRKNKQDTVGAPCSRFGDLIGIEHEVLPQDWQFCCHACSAQEFRSTLKGWRVGENGETGRAAFFVGLCERSGIEISAYEAFRRTCFLDFCNQPATILEAGLRQRLAEPSRGLVGPRKPIVLAV